MLPFNMYILKFCTICSDRRHISDCQGMRIKGHETFGSDEYVQYLDGCVGFTCYAYVKIYEIINKMYSSLYISFTSIKLYKI